MHGITVAATRLHARPRWTDDESSTSHRERRPRCCSPLQPLLWLRRRDLAGALEPPNGGFLH